MTVYITSNLFWLTTSHINSNANRSWNTNGACRFPQHIILLNNSVESGNKSPRCTKPVQNTAKASFGVHDR